MMRLIDHDEDGEEQRRPLDQRDVAFLHRIDGQRAEARQREGHLDIDRPGEEADDDQSGRGDDRDQGVAEDIAKRDPRRAQAARPGEGDIVLVELIDHRGAGDLDDDRHHRERQRQRRQGQVPEAVEEAAPGTEGRKPAEDDAEEIEKQDPGHEGRRRDAEDAEHDHAPVEPRRRGEGGQHAEENAGDRAR